MADVAATSTDKRSVTLLATYNTRSVHAVTHRAQQNLSDFTAIRPCFQQFAVDNVSRSNITTTSNNLLAIASARNTCYVAFQQIASKLLETEQGLIKCWPAHYIPRSTECFTKIFSLLGLSNLKGHTDHKKFTLRHLSCAEKLFEVLTFFRGFYY